MVVKIKAIGYKRIPLSEIPKEPCTCYELMCIYNDGGCVCDEPQDSCIYPSAIIDNSEHDFLLDTVRSMCEMVKELEDSQYE